MSRLHWSFFNPSRYTRKNVEVKCMIHKQSTRTTSFSSPDKNSAIPFSLCFQYSTQSVQVRLPFTFVVLIQNSVTLVYFFRLNLWTFEVKTLWMAILNLLLGWYGQLSCTTRLDKAQWLLCMGCGKLPKKFITLHPSILDSKFLRYVY